MQPVLRRTGYDSHFRIVDGNSGLFECLAGGPVDVNLGLFKRGLRGDKKGFGKGEVVLGGQRIAA